MHNAAYAALGLDWAYVPLPVAPERVGDAVRGLVALGFAGANVTVPHKQAVIPYLDELTPIARTIGAVNTIVVQPDGALLGTTPTARGSWRICGRRGLGAEEQRRRGEEEKEPGSITKPPSAPPHLRTSSPPHLRTGARRGRRGAGGGADTLVETGATVAVANRTLVTAEALC